MKKVCVVGAGVIGLSVSVQLLQSGIEVSVFSDKRLEGICSANAGAIWGPFLSLEDDRVFDWSFRTLKKLVYLSELNETGVKVVDGVLAADYQTNMPEWFHLLGQEHDYHERLPPGYLHGWKYSVPIIDMPQYLRWLESEVLNYGGIFKQRKIFDFEELSDDFDVIVNCTGLGARELCDDPKLYPVKGQLVIVENPGIEKFFAERGDLTNLFYWMPQGDKIVLGGTAENIFKSVAIDEKQIERITAKAAKIDHRFINCKVLGYRVGLRPCRENIKFGFFESDKVFHNYGHGGSGVSLSWGCAQDIVSELENLYF